MLKQLVIYLIKLPICIILNLLSLIPNLLIPKNKNLWVFGSWCGDRFADNSKYLFLYTCYYHKDIEAIWLSRNNSIVKSLREQGYKAYSIYSFRAGAYIFAQSRYKDLNFWASLGKLKVQLWHGLPYKNMKRIYPLKDKFYIIRKFLNFLKEPFGMNQFYVLCPSVLMSEYFASVFVQPLTRILTYSYPRNEILYNKKMQTICNGRLNEIRAKFSNFNKVILYVPTFRDNDTDVFMGTNDTNEIVSFCHFLSENNIALFFKPHFGSKLRINEFPEALKNIIFIEPAEDLYDYLSLVDLLVTDYSSIAIDFLYANRPIIYYIYDYEYYKDYDRGLLPGFLDDNLTPGIKVYEIEGMKNAIKKILIDECDEHSVLREKSFKHFQLVNHESKGIDDLIKYLKTKC
jgi:CDP-glycerol glycerophosphotransferase (TagB/SpsB family)